MLNTEQTMSDSDHDIPDNILESVPAKAWIVCFSAALFFFYEFIQMNMFNAISGQLMQTFSIEGVQLGTLSAFYFYANLLFLFPAGLILDRFSTRKVILTSMVICVGGTFLFALATSLTMAQFFRFLTGIGSAFCFLSSIRLASRWFPAHKMALVTGLIVTMAMIGGMVAQTPLTKLVELLGWRHALFVDAGLGVVIISIVWMYVCDYPGDKQEVIEQEKQNVNDMQIGQSMRLAYLKSQNWLCGAYTSLMNLPLVLLGALWGMLYLQQVHGFTSTQASYVTSMVFVGTIIGAPAAGWISDRIGYRRLPMTIGALISFGLIITIMFWPYHSLLTLMGLFFALGFFTSTQVISYPTVAESNAKSLTATSVSIVSVSAISGYAIFQPIFGWLIDYHWDHQLINHKPVYSIADFHLALAIIPIGFILAFIASLFIRETYCRPLIKG